MKILIVEDDEKLARGLKDGLEKEGFAADIVLNGEAGQLRIEAFHKDYDLVVLDLMLPEKDGLTVLKNIREKNITIPVLVLTARDTTDDIVSGLDKGADDYLSKPFSVKEFFSRVRALLRRPKESLAAEIKTEDLTLNNITKEVFRSNKEIHLTLKEFSLLEFLMRHPDQVMSREQIISNLWDFDFDALSNIVDVHIKNLRKKIDRGYKKKLLETVRGVGYRIRR